MLRNRPKAIDPSGRQCGANLNAQDALLASAGSDYSFDTHSDTANTEGVSKPQSELKTSGDAIFYEADF
jgi:hypothetical protein